jgi:hypothetical protein
MHNHAVKCLPAQVSHDRYSGGDGGKKRLTTLLYLNLSFRVAAY